MKSKLFILLIAGYSFLMLTTCEQKPSAPEYDNLFDSDNPQTGGDPFQLTARIANGGVTLSWQEVADPNLNRYEIHRSEKETTGYSNIGNAAKTDTIYVDKSVLNGHNYWYRVTARDKAGHETEKSLVTPVNINSEPLLVINGGDEYTSSRQVQLTILANTATQMMLSKDAGFSNADWVNYASEKTWQLASGEGEKNVYLKTKYQNGDESDIIKAMIMPLPINPAIKLADSAQFTATRDINIALTAQGDHLQMKISENLEFNGASWQPYSASSNYKLSEGEGLKSVYAKLMDDFEIESNEVSGQIVLDSTAPAIVLSVSPDSGITDETTFEFDPAGSHDVVCPPEGLQIRFDWDNDDMFDTGWQVLAAVNHVFDVGGGDKLIRIQLIDGLWQTDTLVNVYVNTRPQAVFTAFSDNDNYQRYHFDASGSTDEEDGTNLTYRWDFDGDGQWDTSFNSQDTVSHTYSIDGAYSPKLEVSDQQKLSVEYNMQIQVKEPLIKMVLVEGGTFTMGDTWGDGDSDELPTHPVTLRSFYISKYEMTQAQYLEVMGSNPSNFSGDIRPVERVTWYDAVTFCNTLSIQEGLTPCYVINGTSATCDFTANGYRLPTEAEWEYAARGGNQSQGYKFSGSDNVDDVAWYNSNSGNQTHDVGTKQANELGIYDMSGNVYEWCWDWWGNYTAAAQTNPTGPSSGTSRVLRGGSWNTSTVTAERVANRLTFYPANYNYYIGFRISRTK